GVLPWTVSARGAVALRGQARALAEHLAERADDPADVGWSLAATRSAFEHRAVVVGESRDELLAGLAALGAGEEHPGVVNPGTPAVASETGPVLVFPGQGSQWAGMGAELLESSPVFAARIAECEQALAPYVDWSLTEVLRGDGSELARVDVVQPVLWAMMVSLAAVWESHGVTPAAVVGHSQGEIAAACVAGALTLDDGAKVVALRSKALRGLAGGGAMASLSVSAQQAETLLSGDVTIAAINGPSSTVVSGTPEHVAAVVARAEAQGLRARTIDVDYASHGPQVDQIRDELTTILTGITPQAGRVPFYSTVTAARIDTTTLGTGYWVTNLREQVRFTDTVQTLLDDGHRVFIEASPHPVLTSGVEETAEAADIAVSAVPTLRRDNGGPVQLAHALALAFATGTPVDWAGYFPSARRVDLPTYAFQRERYWPSPGLRPAGGDAPDAVERQVWQAIEELDVEALTSTMRLDAEDGAAEDLRPALPILSRWRRRHRERSTLDSWRYRIGWKHLPEPAAPALSGTWLVVHAGGQADHPAVRAAVQAVHAHGGTARPWAVDAAAADRAPLAEQLAERLADPALEGSGPAGVLSLLALDQTPRPGHPAVTAGLAATTALVQAADDAGLEAPLWCVTQGAVAVAPTESLPNPHQTQIWGLGRVAALEYPNRWGGLIDLPTTLDRHTPRRLAAVLTPGQPEDQVAIRATAALGRRMHRAPGTGEDARTPWRPDGTTLITGGTGGLGAHVARWLATNGAPHLILTSRRGPDAPGARELADQLTALGTHVTITACDVSDRDALQHLLDDIPQQHPLTAVFHAAGISDLTTIDELDLARVEKVLLPKARAAEHLHDLTRHLNLSAFVLFSSGAASWGSGQQGAYAASNVYLDALAEHRRGLGLAATSIAWGPWGETGMSADAAVIAFFARRGLAPLDTALAIKSVQRALDHGDTALTIADIHWQKFPAAMTTQRPSPFLGDLAQADREDGAGEETGAGADPLRQELAGSTPKQQLDLLVRRVQTHAATILGHTGADAVPANQPLQELGFDSLTAVELSKRLSTATGLRLPRTLVFDHPTATALGKLLRTELTGQAGAEAAAAPAASAAAPDEPIAIVGMACRYPGGIRNPQQLWDLVAAGRDAIGEMPANRDWDLDGLYHPDPEHPGTSYVRQGAFLYDAPAFDPGFFGISPREALAMDPQQRLLLETAWETFENAGIDQDTLHGSDTGVFTGGTFQGYSASTTQSVEMEGYALAGTTSSVISGRVAYTFGLEGPAVTIDTACSSSLVAIHMAAKALARNECGLALAGGVAVMATPATFIGFSRQRGLAPDGRCKPFAAAADGTSWGEGVGLVLLERLSDARRNGHQVLAIVRGSAVNQDGTSNGLTAPNGPSQQRVINQALANARLAPGEVDAVEAHGTGTTLGDPIEAQAILATYGQDRPEDEPLWLGSVKSNIGHTQMAAGVAGVIKMVLALHNDTLPASLYIDEPTPHVDWDAGAVRLLTEPTPWPERERPRRAGVSAFGISGTNAHVILEEAPGSAAETAAPAEPDGRPVPWVVTARGGGALRAQARALADHLAGRADAPLDVGWSLATRRSAFEHRAVVLGESRDELLAGLRALAAGDEHPGVVGIGGPAVATDTGPVLVFPGQGSQWAGMGAELLESSPVFAARIAECEQALAPYVDWSLTGVLRGDGSELARVDVVQPVLWATMVSLAAVWASHGVVPAAVVGHSQGEIAAACVAGALSLADGAKVVALRSRALRGLAGGGAMASLGVGEDEATRLLEDHPGVTVAAVNGPSSTVLSGPPGQVAAIVERAKTDGLRARVIDVDYASHGPQVDEIRDELAEVLSGIRPFEAAVPFYSTVAAARIDTTGLGTDYWVANLRERVRFADTVRVLLEDGHRVFIEASMHPVLTVGMAETFEDADADAAAVATLHRDRGDHAQLLRSVAEAFTTGTPCDWTAVFGTGPRPPVELPTYAFQHQSYWLAPSVRIGGGGDDAVESRIWQAIEDMDVEALTSTLNLDGEDDADGGEEGADGGGAAEDLRPALPILSRWRRRHRERSTLDSWRYQITWKHLPESASPTLGGTWLVLVPAAHAGHPAVHTVVQALRAHGAEARTHAVDPAATGREEFARLLAAPLAPGDGTGTREDANSGTGGVLSLLSLDGSPHPGHPAVTAGLAATTALVQAAGDTDVPGPLWCLTQGAVAVSPTDPLPNPAQAETWGLGRVAALEYPNRWGGLIDLPTTLDHQTPARLAAVLAPGQPEDQVAIRATAALGRRMHRAPITGDDPHAPWRPDGTTLITGGTGGLGAHVARWLATNGAPHLLLTSRRGPNAPGARELADELTALGTRVTITACDVSDRDALQHLLDDIPREHPLTAVFHAAGLPELTAFDDLTVPHVAEVLLPKARAAEHLHDLTRHLNLTAFVLFSSGASAWGSGQQASYAAANAYLDALAEHRRALGLAATSLAWGPWGESGMAADDGVIAFFARRGLATLAPDLAIKSVQRALDHGDTALTIADIDWETFPATFTTQRPSRLIADLARPARESEGRDDPAGDDDPLRRELAGSTPKQQLDLLVRRVQTHVATILGHTGADAVPANQPLQELGFDSLTAVELSKRLSTATGLQLPRTLVFDHPTATALAKHLRAELTGRADALVSRAAAAAPTDEPIAIVSMACRFPGGVRDPRQLWNLVAAGGDAIGGMPSNRDWDLDGLYHPDPEHPGTSYVREGGFLHDAPNFDAGFFGISPREALAMDPQQRILLEAAWETFENAGLSQDDLNGSNTGVFAGGTFQGYSATTTPAKEVEGYLLVGNTASVMSGRVSYAFGLEGPAVTIDTACSSSLVAIHLAGQALNKGECDLALAGGVTVMATPATFIGFSRQRGLAPDGRCKPFAAAADGTSWGEGVGLVLLERLSDARRNGHRVLATIRGSAVNQDGTSNGLTAPNGPSQQRVINQALANARLTAADVDAVEAHGTGTTLGDPIEAQAILATYGQDRPGDRPLWLGSVKSNIGHTQMAAGVAGVIKMVQALHNDTLPASLHIDEPTPHVDWNAGAVRLLTEPTPWPRGDRPRRAGVSSFGISGTNAHLILEEGPEPAPVPAGPVPLTAAGGLVPWVLSARDGAALRDQAAALAAR
ncbi:type I polyketide synthase, partial [Actinomadura roseirufa]|uniref:type I polyketide synthase n=1 Tax=Actinomadura roseirufa TaxID=2094049 RepID=UPI0010414848